MSGVVANNSLTLDGVMEAPDRPTRTVAAASSTEAGRSPTSIRSWPMWRQKGPPGLVQSLMRRNLVDTKTTTTGVVIATYHPAEPPATKTSEGASL